MSLSLLGGLAARAGEPYFPTIGNRTLYYERYKAGTNKIVQTTLMDVGAILNDGPARIVYYGMTLRKSSGRPMYGGTFNLTTRIEQNGDVMMDLGAAVRCVLQNIFPKANITYTGNAAILPDQMEVGDILPDCHCEVKVSALVYHIDVTERVVLRKEKLVTPAGTYDCVVVREHKVEEGLMHHGDVWTDTWYAPGMGFVRHDNYDKKMRLETSEILISDQRYPTQ
jgi:hypothetical protein